MSKIAKFVSELLQNEEHIALWSSQILYMFALRAGKITIFEPKDKVIIFTARNTNIYKICYIYRAIFSSFYNI
jgi:hypothetical protein